MNVDGSAEGLKLLISEIEGYGLEESLRFLAQSFLGKVSFSTSFGKEDQVITDAIVRSGANIRFFTLDTGRLFAETYSVWSATLEKYDIQIETFTPDSDELNSFLSTKGPNSFFLSVENRKLCCGIRKVQPLRKALEGCNIWITGIRAEQSSNREDIPALEWDEIHGVIKYHPLIQWKQSEVNEYIQKYEVPYNSLHDRGFLSIGCAPCTRAIQQGEDFRAGRWWWEENSKKECGLHIKEKK